LADFDVSAARADTPGVAHGIYLNNASCSLMPRAVVDAVQDHFALAARIGGYPAASKEAPAQEAVYGSVARLIGAGPQDIALVESHTRAWQSVFYGLAFSEGDRILTSRAEYGANYVSFLQMRKRTGCVIEVIPDNNEGAIDCQALEKMIDDRIALIAINWIPTNGGLINPAAEIGAVAKRHGIPYLLDACQAVGQMPVDVERIGCDYLTAAGRKWLRGPKGTGFLYVRRERLADTEPAMIDDVGAAWHAAHAYELRDDARRFESHEHEPALRLGLGAAADYALALGLDTIRSRVRELAEGLREALVAMPGITVHDLGSERAGLVTFAHESVDAGAIVTALERQNICVKAVPREGALLDTVARNLPVLVRISPHYYNSEQDLEHVLTALRESL